MTTIPSAEGQLITEVCVCVRGAAKGLKYSQLFLIEIKTPKWEKSWKEQAGGKKKKMQTLKILLKTNLVNINLQTLTAKNRWWECWLSWDLRAAIYRNLSGLIFPNYCFQLPDVTGGKKKKKCWLKRQWKFKISDVLTMNLVVSKHRKSEFYSLYQLRAWRTTGKNTRYECQSKGTTQPETPGTFPGGKALLASFQCLVHTSCVKDNSNCNPRNAQLNS